MVHKIGLSLIQFKEFQFSDNLKNQTHSQYENEIGTYLK